MNFFPLFFERFDNPLQNWLLNGIITAEQLLYQIMARAIRGRSPLPHQWYHTASRTWHHTRKANGKALCGRHPAAAAAKQRAAHVAPQPKPALPFAADKPGRVRRCGQMSQGAAFIRRPALQHVMHDCEVNIEGV